MKKIRAAMAATLCAGALAACSMMDDETPAPTSGTIEENTVEVTAKVKEVDQATRMVTLLTSSGEVVTFHAPPEIRNLAQLEAGDVVRAQYFESVVYEVKRPGEAVPGVRMAEDAESAPLGAKPGVGAARAVMVTATVQAVDKNAPSVTLRTADGNVTTLAVRDPRRLEAVKPGDLVEFTYTQAIAVAVDEIEN